MSSPPRSELPTLLGLPLVIDTPRLRMRPVTEGDAPAFLPLVRDPLVSEQMTWRPRETLDETRAWLASTVAELADDVDVTWAIEQDGAIVGKIGLSDIRWASRAVRFDQADLGYWLAPALWGKGLMSEAVAHVLPWAFDVLGLHKVTASCFETNAGSKRVLEKAGFRFVGRSEEDVWRDGRWYAHLRFELLAAAWSDMSRTLRFQRQS